MFRKTYTQKQWIYMIVGASIATTLLGFIAGQFVTSPAELAARTGQPDASLISSAVERRLISSNLNLRGEVSFSSQIEVNAPVSSSDDPQVVISIAEEDQEIKEGELVADISSRPIILLQGEFESYRGFTSGAKGLDVEQLDVALQRLGLLSGKPNNVFDAQTQAGVVSLYRRLGYEVTGPTSEEQTQLREAQKEVGEAQAGYSVAVADISSTKLSQARNEVTKSQNDYNDAVAKASSDNAEAQAALSGAQSQLTQKQADLSFKQGLLTTAEGGVNPYNNLAPSGPTEEAELGVIVSELTLQVNELTSEVSQSQADVTAKTANVSSTAIAGNSSISNASLELNGSQNTLNDVLAKAANTSNDPDVKVARDRLDNARKTLSELSEKTGVKVLSGEIVFINGFTSKVNSVNVSRGQRVEGPIMTISDNSIAIETSVSKADRKFVEPGIKAEVTLDESSKKLKGYITQISTSTGTDGAGDGRYAVKISAEDIEPEDAGQQVRVSVSVKTTDGKVLAVPIAAISVDGDGNPRVEKVIDAKKRKSKFIEIETGLRAQGYVEIKKVKDLKKGDQVVVGSAKNKKD